MWKPVRFNINLRNLLEVLMQLNITEAWSLRVTNTLSEVAACNFMYYLFCCLSFTQTLPTAKYPYILLSTFFRVYRVVYWNADDVGVHVKKMRITLRDMRLSHLSSLVLKDYLSRLWRCQFYRHFSFNTIIPLIKFWTCTINFSWNSFSFFFWSPAWIRRESGSSCRWSY